MSSQSFEDGDESGDDIQRSLAVYLAYFFFLFIHVFLFISEVIKMYYLMRLFILQISKNTQSFNKTKKTCAWTVRLDDFISTVSSMHAILFHTSH